MKFDTLTERAVDQLFGLFLRREATPEELVGFQKNFNDPFPMNGLGSVSTPFWQEKPTILIYAACHGQQILNYWARHGDPWVRDNRNVILFHTHRVELDAKGDLEHAYYWEFIKSIVHSVSVVVYQPTRPGTVYSSAALVGDRQPSVSFHSPSFAEFWPAVRGYAEAHIIRELEKGVSTDELKSRLRKGTLDCDYAQRFVPAVARLRRKDAAVMCGFTDFFLKHWRKHRMFLAFNHPSYNLMAYQAARLLKWIKAGSVPFSPVPELTFDEEYEVLALGDNEAELDTYPDHWSAFRDLQLTYEPKYKLEEANVFFESVIDGIATRYNERKL